MVSLKTLKDEYLVDDNLDDKYILSVIKKAQDFKIRRLLGDTKFNELISQISTGTVTEANAALLVQIEPVLAYFAMSEIVYSTAYKLKNQGVDLGDPNRFDELVRISKKYLNDSNQYTELLKEYMCDNGITIYDVMPYKTGIYLGYTSDYANLTNTFGYDLPNS